MLATLEPVCSGDPLNLLEILRDIYSSDPSLLSRNKLTAIKVLARLGGSHPEINASLINKIKRSKDFAQIRGELSRGLSRRRCPRWSESEIQIAISLLNSERSADTFTAKIRACARDLSTRLPNRSAAQISANLKLLYRARRIRCNNISEFYLIRENEENSDDSDVPEPDDRTRQLWNRKVMIFALVRYHHEHGRNYEAIADDILADTGTEVTADQVRQGLRTERFVLACQTKRLDNEI